MDDIQDRLTRCFTTVFPELDSPSAPAATVDAVEAWDSVAALSLLAVIEEEFGVNIGYDHLDDLVSYAALEACVRERLAGGA